MAIQAYTRASTLAPAFSFVWALDDHNEWSALVWTFYAISVCFELNICFNFRYPAWPESKNPVVKDLSLLLGRSKGPSSDLNAQTDKQGKTKIVLYLSFIFARWKFPKLTATFELKSNQKNISVWENFGKEQRFSCHDCFEVFSKWIEFRLYLWS